MSDSRIGHRGTSERSRRGRVSGSQQPRQRRRPYLVAGVVGTPPTTTAFDARSSTTFDTSTDRGRTRWQGGGGCQGKGAYRHRAGNFRVVMVTTVIGSFQNMGRTKLPSSPFPSPPSPYFLINFNSP